MFDSQKIDAYFNGEKNLRQQTETSLARRAKIMRWIKLALPCFAALLIGLLIIIPHLQNDGSRMDMDVTLPKKGELEKLHMEETVFYITDADNKVNNFNADKIDETEPGSKLLKLTNPQGIVPGSNQTWDNIQAPTGYFNQLNSVLQLIDNVEMFYSDGMTAHSTEMFFDFKHSKAYGVKPVTVDGETSHIEAEGFEYDNKKNLLTFTGKTYITIPEEQLKGND